MNKDIPVICLQRFPIYLNYLKSLDNSEGYISSGAIARALGMGEVLVRKDLALTAAQGRTRVGYRCGELIAALEDFLGCNRMLSAVVVGVGGLGHALLSYSGFKNYGIDIVAAFDSDPAKIGTCIAKKPVYDVATLSSAIVEIGARLAIICVPATAAQEVSNKLVDCGISAILNFAPTLIKVPESVIVRNIDVAANLAILSSQI